MPAWVTLHSERLQFCLKLVRFLCHILHFWLKTIWIKTTRKEATLLLWKHFWQVYATNSLSANTDLLQHWTLNKIMLDKCREKDVHNDQPQDVNCFTKHPERNSTRWWTSVSSALSSKTKSLYFKLHRITKCTNILLRTSSSGRLLTRVSPVNRTPCIVEGIQDQHPMSNQGGSPQYAGLIITNVEAIFHWRQCSYLTGAELVMGCLRTLFIYKTLHLYFHSLLFTRYTEKS